MGAPVDSTPVVADAVAVRAAGLVCLERIGAGLEGRLGPITADVQAAIAAAVDVSVEDAQLRALREASIAENVSAMVHLVRHGSSGVDLVAPNAALEYSRRCAAADVPAAQLVRCYRAGQTRVLRHCVEELTRQATEASRHSGTATTPALTGALSIELFECVSTYIDRVLDQVLAEYEEAWERHRQSRTAVVAARVRELIENDVHDSVLSDVFGYPLAGWHLGAVLWVRPEHQQLSSASEPFAALESGAHVLARSVSGRQHPLIVPLSDESAWVWLGARHVDAARLNALSQAAAGLRHLCVCLGEPGEGVGGFRRSHRQAKAASDVARLAPPERQGVVTFGEVAPVSLLCGDVEAAQAWVAETLGELAGDSERHESLRETSRVYLSTGGSLAATAEQMFVHRNTAQYRVKQAELLRGRSLRAGRLDVELALLVCRWLGSRVLNPVVGAASTKVAG